MSIAGAGISAVYDALQEGINNSRLFAGFAIAALLSPFIIKSSFWFAKKSSAGIDAIGQRSDKKKENIECDAENLEAENYISNKDYVYDVGLKENLHLKSENPVDVIMNLEGNLYQLYFDFCASPFSVESGRALFEGFRTACESSELPPAAETRFRSLLDEYRDKFIAPDELCLIDRMGEFYFRVWLIYYLPVLGFSDVKSPKDCEDLHVDTIAQKDDDFYAFRCVFSLKTVDETPIHEIYNDKAIEVCRFGIVVTNQYFTHNARILAKSKGVHLWDRDKLGELLGLTPDETYQPKY